MSEYCHKHHCFKAAVCLPCLKEMHNTEVARLKAEIAKYAEMDAESIRQCKAYRDALEETTALIDNVFSDAEPETRSYYSEWVAVLKQAREAFGGDK